MSVPIVDIDITPELVRGLWDHMAATFGSTTANKEDSQLMHAIAEALGTMGIIRPKSFLEDFTTTIHTTIYTPFEIGVPGDGGRHSLEDQLILCVHEHHHVHQARREGCASFFAKYLGNPTHRAHYESEAYRCDLEMSWFLHARTMDPNDLAESLKHYGVGPADRAVAAKELRMSAKMVRAGGIHNKTSKEAINWLSRQKG